MAGGNREPGRSVTSKVIAILGAFEKDPRPLGLSEIAQLADLPLSTTHRLVNELTAGDLLTRTAEGHYQLGLRTWELAQNVGRQLRETARPFVHDLYSLTGETAQLVVREGNEALLIERAYGTKKVPRSSRVGGRLPLHSTAVGKILLAFDEPWIQDAYLKLPLTSSANRTITDPAQLATQLRQIKSQGFSITVDEHRNGAASIAVPVWHTGTLGAGLGVVVPTAQASTLERFLPILQASSQRLTRATAHIPLDTLLSSHRTTPRRR
ncbi:IclR family transcriptional regulator [Corynebacterium sp. A21]|uniref:IclR family transcriptional regulator n=1 Tax=Corynebacterium sp. A21 TaxID=3457318 RepID=UPI003FCFF48C